MLYIYNYKAWDVSMTIALKDLTRSSRVTSKFFHAKGLIEML